MLKLKLKKGKDYYIVVQCSGFHTSFSSIGIKELSERTV